MIPFSTCTRKYNLCFKLSSWGYHKDVCYGTSDGQFQKAWSKAIKGERRFFSTVRFKLSFVIRWTNFRSQFSSFPVPNEIILLRKTPQTSAGRLWLAWHDRQFAGVFKNPTLGRGNRRAKGKVFPEEGGPRYRVTTLWGAVVRLAGQGVHYCVWRLV